MSDPTQPQPGFGQPADPYSAPPPYGGPYPGGPSPAGQSPYGQPTPGQPGAYGPPNPNGQPAPNGQQPNPYGQSGAYGQQLNPYGQPMPPAPQFGPNPYGQAPNPYQHPPVIARQMVSALPTEPVEYQQMLRGPQHRWWRTLLSALLLGGFAFAAINIAQLLLIVGGAIAGIEDPANWSLDVINPKSLGPIGFAMTLVSLIVLIPAAMLAIRIAHRVRPRFLSSVVGGIRWGWLGRCLLVTLPIWVVYLGVSFWLDPATSPRPPHWWILLIMVVLFVPFQAAGEEYAFRGWMMQSIGSLFKHRLLALAVPLVISVAVFAIAHGSTNFWVLADLGLFALVATILTWRTGGLEAAIAIHAVNNVSLFIVVLIFGGWEDAFVSGETTSTFGAFAITLVVQSAATAAIWWQAKKFGVQRLYQPEQPAPAQPVIQPGPSGWQPQQPFPPVG